MPIIFDDVNRKAKFKLMKDVAKKLNKPFKVYSCKNFRGTDKLFGVIK